MPKQCKPTEKAVNMRIDAYFRLLRMQNAYIPENIVPIEIFGIKHKIKKEGLFTIDNIINELK